MKLQTKQQRTDFVSHIMAFLTALFFVGGTVLYIHLTGDWGILYPWACLGVITIIIVIGTLVHRWIEKGSEE